MKNLVIAIFLVLLLQTCAFAGTNSATYAGAESFLSVETPYNNDNILDGIPWVETLADVPSHESSFSTANGSLVVKFHWPATAPTGVTTSIKVFPAVRSEYTGLACLGVSVVTPTTTIANLEKEFAVSSVDTILLDFAQSFSLIAPIPGAPIYVRLYGCVAEIEFAISYVTIQWQDQ